MSSFSTFCEDFRVGRTWVEGTVPSWLYEDVEVCFTTRSTHILAVNTAVWEPAHANEGVKNG
jgi:hypothetical protein